MKTIYTPHLKERFEACLLCGGIGDAIGWQGSTIEFQPAEKINEQIQKRGSLISFLDRDNRVSDDTILHLALCKALAKNTPDSSSERNTIITYMLDYFHRYPARGYGFGTRQIFRKYQEKGIATIMDYDPRGGGCGAAMRIAGVALRYLNQPEFIARAMAYSMITHTHPVGFLGGLAVAAFVHDALNDVPHTEWLNRLTDFYIPAADELFSFSVFSAQHEGVKYFLDKINFFKSHYQDYDNYGDLYREISFNKISGGWSGHDAPLIAWYALDKCNNDFEKLLQYAVVHDGDSDSTGAIAGNLYGAVYGYKNVPVDAINKVELSIDLTSVADRLYDLAMRDGIAVNEHA